MEEKAQPQLSEIPTLTPTQKRRKIILLLGALIGINALVFGGLYSVISKGGSAQKISNVKSSVVPTPTPYPFEELTIPYLRSRKYVSELSVIEENSRNGDYASNLASYESDGNTIFAQLTIPTGKQPEGGWPAIIFVHGYIPPANYQTFSNYSSYVDYLARNGFVVFKIDLRGHGQSEGDPGGAYYSSDYVVDVLSAYSALENYEFVNPSKIGLWGHSMAGNVVSRALGAKPDIPAIAIWGGAVYTYSDFSEFSIEDNSYQPPSEDSPSRKKRNEMFEKYGTFDPNSSFWKMVPVTNYLDGITGAISLNHTVDDSVVDIRYSRNFNEILNKTTIPHELNEYQSGGHNFTGSAFTEAMDKTVDFYKKYLN
ncbi:MAG: alpha/beta fold hydrolase [Candidatus Levybacteria bacterium]|nr:alpha/beta fold hydrolase [Candidatus Levybacteria bacterium]